MSQPQLSVVRGEEGQEGCWRMRTESLRHHELQESVYIAQLVVGLRDLGTKRTRYVRISSFTELARYTAIHHIVFHLAHACCTRKLVPEKDIQNIGAALERATEWARCVSAERRESRYCVPSFLLYFFPPVRRADTNHRIRDSLDVRQRQSLPARRLASWLPPWRVMWAPIRSAIGMP